MEEKNKLVEMLEEEKYYSDKICGRYMKILFGGYFVSFFSVFALDMPPSLKVRDLYLTGLLLIGLRVMGLGGYKMFKHDKEIRRLEERRKNVLEDYIKNH